MNWKKDYDEKSSTPEEAIKDIHDGDCVVMGHAAAAPRIIQHAGRVRSDMPASSKGRAKITRCARKMRSRATSHNGHSCS